LEIMGKTMAQLVEERGRAEGRTEGEAHGLRRALRTLLENRFGALDPDTLAALGDAGISTLDVSFRAALDARSLGEVGIPSNERGA
jgi:hypothetical protein